MSSMSSISTVPSTPFMDPVSWPALLKGISLFVAMTMSKFVVNDVHDLCDDFGSTIMLKAAIMFFIFFNGAQNFQTAFLLTGGAFVWLSLLRTRKNQLDHSSCARKPTGGEGPHRHP